MKKLVKVLLTVALAFGIIVFGVNTPINAATVKLNKTSLTLNVGDSKKLKVKGSKAKVTWSTSDKKVAAVNKNGKVTAKGAGNCTITAKVGSKSLTCKVTVKAKKTSAFDSKVKIANVTFPSCKSWLDLSALSQGKIPEQQGAGMAMYSVDTKASSLILYVAQEVSESDMALYTSSKEYFQLLSEIFTQALLGSIGNDADISTSVIKENGEFIGKTTGTVSNDSGKYAIVVYFKFLGKNMICTGGMNQGKSLSSTTDSLAYDALIAAKG